MAKLQLIKKFAAEQKISLSELARRVGISEQQIHMMCRTNSTKIPTLERIAKELGVPAAIFMDDDIETLIKYAGRDYNENGRDTYQGPRIQVSGVDASVKDVITASMVATADSNAQDKGDATTDNSSQKLTPGELLRKIEDLTSENEKLSKLLINVQQSLINYMMKEH